MDGSSDSGRRKEGRAATTPPRGRPVGGAGRNFERFARLAARLYGARRGALILSEGDSLRAVASVGFDIIRDWPRASSYSGLVVDRGVAMLSPDVGKDARFKGRVPATSQATRFFAAAPLVSSRGEILGVLSVGDDKPRRGASDKDLGPLVDLAMLAAEELERVDEVEEARRERRLDRERVELVLQAAGLGEFEWDIDSDRVFVSDRLRELTGGLSSEMPAEGGQLSFRFLHPGDVDAVRAVVGTSLTETGRYDVEYRIIRPDDGRTRWMRGWGVAVPGEGGARGKLIGVVQDITDRKLEEEQRETLLAELDHRVKNVLAAVQSLAAQSARKTVSLDSFLKTFAGRLKAMAAAHELLTATRWRGAAIGDIVTAELSGLAPGQARWEGPEFFLSPRAANALSLALHELATNAVKYGALSVENGRIEVAWRDLDDGGFALDWKETGGPPVSPPTRRGFGATLLEQVTGRELGGSATMDFRPDGARARIIADAHARVKAPAGTAPSTTPVVGPEAANTDGHIIETLTGASLGGPDGAGGVAGLRLLIVEDAVLLALELESGLTDAGAEVVGSAADLDEALAMLGLSIDAAVLDANLNGKSVAPVAEALKARGTPFVFATGYGDAAAPGGFDAPIVRKPYNVNQIIRALAQVTGRA